MHVHRFRDRTVLAAALLTLLTAGSVAGQQRPPRAAPAGSRTLELGARAGFDFDQQAAVLGTFLRVPVDPWRRLAFMPGAEVEFLTGRVEWQLNADAVVLLGRNGSYFVGGGGAFRNARYPDMPDERETRLGYSLIVGLRSSPPAGGVGSQFEFRWTEVDAYNPRVVTFGLTWGLPLGF